MDLYGTVLTPREVRRRVGRLGQAGGIERFVFDEGPARGEPCGLGRAASRGPLFTGLMTFGIALYGHVSGVPRAQALLIDATLWLIPGSVVDVYDRAVICVGPGGNYAGSQTIANDPRAYIS